MLDTFAVVIALSDQETVRIGPFIAPTNAARYAARLRTLASARSVPAVIHAETTDPDLPHLDARLPTDPWSLGKLIAEQETQHGDQPPFPDLYTRLVVQLGQENANTVWGRATGWGGPGDDQARRIELIEAAEDWREKRAQSVAALQRIAVELWLADLHNIRQIGGITGLSRAHIYATLRDNGIEPTDRSADTGSADAQS